MLNVAPQKERIPDHLRAMAEQDDKSAASGKTGELTKGLPVCVTGARGSPRLSRVDGELIAILAISQRWLGSHISDLHFHMRTRGTHAYHAFPAARATRTPSPAYACGGCHQRVSS